MYGKYQGIDTAQAIARSMRQGGSLIFTIKIQHSRLINTSLYDIL